MIDTETSRKLRSLGMSEMIDIIELMEKDPSYANLTFDQRLKMIVDYVAQEKENASVKRLLERAHLRIPTADISNVIYEGRSLSRDMVNTVGTCQFAKTSTDIIIEGFTGSGKTHLMCAFAKQACKSGLSTLYVRMPDLFLARQDAIDTGTSESKLLKKYSRYRVLAIDEWLVDPLLEDQMRFLFELVERRHDNASNIFVTQYKFDDWHRRLGGGVHADAIMDRITHNAITIETGNVNMRKKITEQREGLA